MKKVISYLKLAINIIISILIINNIFVVPVYAAGEVQEITKIADNSISLSGIISAGGDFIADGEGQQNDTFDMGAISGIAGSLYAILLGIGFALAVVIGVVIGIKFMMSSSSDERAQYKKTIIVYVVGVVVIFGAFGIWRIIINMMNEVQPQTTATPSSGTYQRPAAPQSSSSGFAGGGAGGIGGGAW